MLLSRQFAVIRAIAVAAAVAIPFGLKLPNADWMLVAALAAMKPSLEQSTLVAVQRLAGTAIGAVVASVFLLGVDSTIILGVVVGGLAGAIRAVNYAWYCAAVAGTVLIAEGLPHPTNLSEEARRVGFTLHTPHRPAQTAAPGRGNRVAPRRRRLRCRARGGHPRDPLPMRLGCHRP